MHEKKPRFGRFETWGACSRCGARVKYSTLARERLTGLLVCTSTSGRPVKPCLDPWPPVFDFQVLLDSSTDPPPEPLPVRWGLDDIWSANKMKMAPNDATRIQSYMIPPTNNRSTASFVDYQRTLNQNQDRPTITHINPANYDGTFIPSNSVRTVEPPDGIMPWAIEPNDPPAHFPEPTPPDTTPNWVPANAKIHIDFLGGTPQGRAWTETNGEVTVDTLLGSDPNTEAGYDVTSYNPEDITPDGYVSSPVALIGDARTRVITGSTLRTQTKASSTGANEYCYIMSANGNYAVFVEQRTVSPFYMDGGSYGGTSWQVTNCINISAGAINVLAATITPARLEGASNGFAVELAVLTATDWPPDQLVAVLLSVEDGAALQSITIYDPLPTTAGLSELSAL